MTARQERRLQVVSTVAGLVLAAWCAWELHRLMASGAAYAPLHDRLMLGIAFGCFIAFPGTLMRLVPHIPFLKSNGGSSS